MRDLESKFPLLMIAGLVIVSVYPLLAIEYAFSKTSLFIFISAISEELIKSGIIVYFILKFKPDLKHAIMYGIAAGFTFGFVENMIYAVRFIPRPDFSVVLINRFLQPFLIHLASSVLFAVMAQKKYPILGAVAAIIFHMIYNFAVVSGS